MHLIKGIFVMERHPGSYFLRTAQASLCYRILGHALGSETFFKRKTASHFITHAVNSLIVCDPITVTDHTIDKSSYHTTDHTNMGPQYSVEFGTQCLNFLPLYDFVIRVQSM